MHAYVYVCKYLYVCGTRINSDVSPCLPLCLRGYQLFPTKYPSKLAPQLLESQLHLMPFLPYGPWDTDAWYHIQFYVGSGYPNLGPPAQHLIFLLNHLPCLETLNPHLNTGEWSTAAVSEGKTTNGFSHCSSSFITAVKFPWSQGNNKRPGMLLVKGQEWVRWGFSVQLRKLFSLVSLFSNPCFLELIFEF